MADAKGKKDTEQAAAPEANQAKRLGIRLQPVDNSDQPVLANYTLGQVLAQLRQAATARPKKDA